MEISLMLSMLTPKTRFEINLRLKFLRFEVFVFEINDVCLPFGFNQLQIDEMIPPNSSRRTSFQL